MNPQYFTRREAAEFLTNSGYPISWKTLQKLACTGGGPLYQIFGNRALYSPGQLIDWANSRTTEPKRSSSQRSRRRKPPEL